MCVDFGPGAGSIRGLTHVRTHTYGVPSAQSQTAHLSTPAIAGCIGLYSLYTHKRSRLEQQHSLQNLILTFYFYKNIYQKVVYIYFYGSIFQNKFIHIFFIFLNLTI